MKFDGAIGAQYALRYSPLLIYRITPLPKLQVAVIAAASLSEPVTVTFIYPFINEVGVFFFMSTSSRELARLSGLLFACYAFTQFISTYFWGTLSDRVGRKPILLTCLLICAISTVGFGAGNTFLEILIFRTLTGTSYGDVPAMADITDSTNQARAFSFIPLCWAVGTAVSPLIGGFLSHPEKHFPGGFGNSAYFIHHPYALPCFTVAGISFILFLLVAFILEETLGPQKRKATSITPSTANVPSRSIPKYGSTDISRPQNGDVSPTTSDPSAESLRPESISAPSPRLFALQILGDPLVRDVLISYGLLAFTSNSNDIIFALWMFLPIDDGGLGFSPSQIAAIISIGNIMGAFVITIIFPWVHRRFGTLPIYRFAMGLNVLLVMLYPVVHALAVNTAVQFPRDPGEVPLSDGMWSNVSFPVLLGIGVMLTLKGISVLAWGGNIILVTAAAPSARSLGTVNSLAQMTASLARSIAPPLYTNIFAISMGDGGNGLIWIFMPAMALLSVLASFRAKEGQREWRRSVG
ncbi:hypothetical protein BS47DRAFT_1307824 [Hydnum rufescens UP504]|uniref:Major facilitator superfamily (MFS) profile domain-containing protein n=1 Tax=Hydnum rufescens UP504 TaxID=1448309 RepID=A0A9P6AFB5_9AGAM|nr:hypothetical protein BS47DRAFT_1307824 [Hydnum rufescens UP504]